MSAFTAEQRAELLAAAQQSRAEADLESQTRRTDCDLLLLPEAQPVILRVAQATDSEYAGRLEHIARVALLALNAKRHPRNAYAKATLHPRNIDGSAGPHLGRWQPDRADKEQV